MSLVGSKGAVERFRDFIVRPTRNEYLRVPTFYDLEQLREDLGSSLELVPSCFI